MRFKLLRGVHQQSDADGKDATFKAGDTFECDYDLEMKHGRDKFQNLDRLTNDDASVLKRRIAELEAQLAAAKQGAEFVDEEEDSFEPLILPENLAYMEVDQLRSFAEENGVDLGAATKKNEIIKVLKAVAAESAA